MPLTVALCEFDTDPVMATTCTPFAHDGRHPAADGVRRLLVAMLKSTLNLRRAVARRASSEVRTPGYTSSSRITAAVIVPCRNSTPSSASTEVTSTIRRWTAAGSLSVLRASTSTSRVARRRSNAASSIPPFSTSVWSCRERTSRRRKLSRT
jgi:hypothetical protein